jgi:Tfp pilus assembly protein FimT
MLMKSRKTNKRYQRKRASGFSLIEMVTVLALTIVLSVISVMSLIPILNAQHVTNAYNLTLAALRQARDNAVSQRTSYEVSFIQTTTPPIAASISVMPTIAGFQGDQSTVTYQFPTDVLFFTPPSGTPAPDSSTAWNFGTGGNSIDFGYTANGNAGGATQTIIYFCPDGSAQTSSSCSGAGMWDNGVIYMGRNTGNNMGSATVDTLSERAITLYGGTGRIHGWRL